MSRLANLVGRALRETGQALDRVGLTVARNPIHMENFSRHRPVMNLYDQAPSIAKNAFIAPSATVVGDVEIESGVSIWYGAVIRGDTNKVTIAENTNIQDRAIISSPTANDPESRQHLPGVHIGANVTVGHGALLTCCSIGDSVLIGQGAIIEHGVVVEKQSIVGAGAVVREGSVVKSGQLWAGNPAVHVRDLSAEEMAFINESANRYSKMAQQHQAEFAPFDK